MRHVSRFEANLIQILRCLVGQVPVSPTLPLILRTMERPPCLSRDCIELIKQSLGVGTMQMLAGTDGWTRERFLRNGEIAKGRLWERTRPEKLGLEFSVNSIEFLIWLTAENPSGSHWKLNKLQELTRGDEFLIFLAFDALRATDVWHGWCGREVFMANGLCAIMHPDKFADRNVRPAPRFEPWLNGPGAAILESLQSQLADRWVEIERRKEKIATPKKMVTLGECQRIVLEAFLAAIDQTGRRDLARFALIAMQRLLHGRPDARRWIGSLDVGGLRIADRMESYRAAFTFLQQMQRLGQWQEQAIDMRYYDEEYAASQLWKADWEQFEGDAISELAQAIMRTMEPLQARAPDISNE